MNMEYSNVGLNDLPDEILLIILKKLNNFDIHYSLQGVNQRLTQFIQDSIFTKDLYFTEKSSNKFIDRLSDEMTHDRFCLQVLPSIHDKIEFLALESSSMKSVLHASHYDNLHYLALYNVDDESFRSLLADRNLSVPIFMNRITVLILACNRIEDYFEMLSSVTKIFECLFPIFMKLKYLVLRESSYKNCVRLNFDDPLILNFRSSTLLYLDVKVQSYDDCLYLLDGRFNQLHTLIIDVINCFNTREVDNQDHLPNLKYFSFSCNIMRFYDNEISRSLLSRMSNLERLDLYIMFDCQTTFIDGNYLKKNILNSMMKLNEFHFSITSRISNVMKLNLPSTEDIQRTFIHFQTKNIISYVDYFPESKNGLCHIYSYPFKMIYYSDITNQFPDGLYEYVRKVSLFDEKPFEHEFFLRIQKSFPLLEILYVKNKKPQSHKQLNDNQQYLSLIQFSSLSELHLADVHDDYIEEFLFHTKTYLAKNVNLFINNESLERITHNFTRECTRINCTKVDKLYLLDNDKLKCENSLGKYFPIAKIIYPKRY
ncbi:unnamed protein product [Adineta steineri]|uniref:F-box domain-containing protein n=1 Tax=Adineta steineri TaxID=433720 RepID=A0A819WDM3_9BILA|nr:unnamed protein product [Adineta steineri]CAF4121302.1 unnamed protein product [Adineta steineri]